MSDKNKKKLGILNPPKDLHQIYFFWVQVCQKVASLITVAQKCFTLWQLFFHQGSDPLSVYFFLYHPIYSVSLLFQSHCFYTLNFFIFTTPLQLRPGFILNIFTFPFCECMYISASIVASFSWQTFICGYLCRSVLNSACQ